MSSIDAATARARLPDVEGHIERDGVRVFYEVYDNTAPTLLLLTPWAITHARMWKMQVPYLSRHFRVIVLEARGNGRSDRPLDPAKYAEAESAADALAALDVTKTPSATLVAFSASAQRALMLAAEHPGRVEGVVFICPAVRLGPPNARMREMGAFDRKRDSYEGWAKWNRHHWAEDLEDFVRFFFAQVHNEPHSTKAIEDGVRWSLETTAGALIASVGGAELDDAMTRELAARIRCPALVIRGSEDALRSQESAALLAELTRGSLVTIDGSGHGVQARQPVAVNLLVRDFVRPEPPPAAWTTAARRRRRALYISSPIGLGHARRDIAIADELRELHPDVEIEWLAQHPVTAVLEARGERIHPASAHMASEMQLIDAEAGEHDLHCFQAMRRMDEILLANFMLFHDVVRETHFDLWIADEAWELDHYLHENPEQKRAAYVWLTDFVGLLPMPEGGDVEAAVTADYNAEMLEHIARYPRLRDRAIFVGNPDDVVDDAFGPGLPSIHEWTRDHFDFSGYVTGFEPSEIEDRARLRAELGYGPDEQVCVVTVGGSGVGVPLLRRIVEAAPAARERLPRLRMVVVAGPRIDPRALPAQRGVEVRGYVPDLHRHLAVCDLAVIQGGLTTSMELTASGRPFLYFPLRRHFEQTYHVPHRLRRYGAGRRMEYARETPESIAAAIAEEMSRPVDYRSVEQDGARRAAALIGELL